MFLHITVNQLHGRPIVLILFYPLYYDIINLTSLKITQAFHLLLVFAENQVVFSNFIIRNSVRITEGLDNGDSDNRGPTVYTYIHTYIYIYTHITFSISALCEIVSGQLQDSSTCHHS